MGNIVSLGKGYTNPKVLLQELMERDDLEWIAIAAQPKEGPPIFEATNDITLAGIAFVACSWQDVFSKLAGMTTMEK